MSEISLKEVEVQKLNLQPGEVLIMKIYSDEVDQEDVAGLRQHIKNLFPNNEVLMLLLPQGKIEIEVARAVVDDSPVQTNVGGSCALPTSYCNDCSCGKKEMIESINKGE